ncbi:inositol monophosphatase family protein [Nesterenkonia sp. F]|uniref:inositol monophosphatase family protein n=1 Tax=Nesterenkonia sp. F TaxID=795955 RepID=UPI000255CAF7|nr:inositol monophosphatase family protein [Nesterenkonia sp. F]
MTSRAHAADRRTDAAPSPSELRRLAVDAALDAGAPLVHAFRSQMDVATKSSSHDLVTAFDTATEERLVAALTAAVPDSQFTGEEGGSHGSGAVEWIIDPIDGTSNFAHGFAMFSISIAAAVDGEVVAGVVHDPIGRLTFSADDSGAWLQDGDGERALGPAGEDGARRRPRAEETLNLVTSYPSAEIVESAGPAALQTFGTLVTTYSAVRRLISGALELCHAAAGWADVVLGADTSPWDVAAGMLILRRAGGRYLVDGGAPGAADHLAPHYLGLAPGVEAPTARRALAEITARGGELPGEHVGRPAGEHTV